MVFTKLPKVVSLIPGNISILYGPSFLISQWLLISVLVYWIEFIYVRSTPYLKMDSLHVLDSRWWQFVWHCTSTVAWLFVDSWARLLHSCIRVIPVDLLDKADIASINIVHISSGLVVIFKRTPINRVYLVSALTQGDIATVISLHVVFSFLVWSYIR